MRVVGFLIRLPLLSEFFSKGIFRQTSRFTFVHPKPLFRFQPFPPSSPIPQIRHRSCDDSFSDPPHPGPLLLLSGNDRLP